MNDKNTFNQFGYQFQIKILTAFLIDRDFARQTNDSLIPDYFESKSLKWLVEQSTKYFNEYKIAPTLDVFKVQVSNLERGSLLQTEIVNSIKEVYKNIESTDLEFTKKKTIDFLRHQNVSNAVISGMSLLENGDQDGFVKLITDANNKILLDHNIGQNYLEDVDFRYSDQGEVKRIPTGWKVIDDLMQGGMPLGKFGFFLGDSGVGKSFSLVHLGAEALKLGYDVVHWTFELDENYVAYRYDAKLTGIALNDLKFNLSDIKKRLQKYPGRLIIKEFPAGYAGMNDLRTHRDKLHSQGIRPQLFINDYLDLMKKNARKDARTDEVLQELYREYRGFAQESEAAAWSVSQSNKLNANKSIGVKEALGGSYAKGAEADFWGIIGRNSYDKLHNKAIFDIQKNRFGPDGMQLPAKFDTAHSNIEIFNEKSETGKKIKKEIVSDEDYAKEWGAQQYEKMLNSNRTEPKKDMF